MTLGNLAERDLAFFNEVNVLINNKFPDMKEKFGIWRIHQHFEISENEVFHETSNDQARESTLRIINKDELPEKAFVSTWRLSDCGPISCSWCCDDSPLNRPMPGP